MLQRSKVDGFRLDGLVTTEDNIEAMPRWSVRLVAKRAAEQGIAPLTEEHWRVIHFLRDQYRRFGGAPTARELLRELEHEIGSRKQLYELFPHGPINQGCRLAGVPAPADTLDRSFGSTH